MPFNIIRELGIGTLNPPVDMNVLSDLYQDIEPLITTQAIKEIYASPSERCRTTALFLQAALKKEEHMISTYQVDALKEIEFDLYQLMPAEERALKDLSKLNNAVFSGMVTGQGAETATQAIVRFTNWFTTLPTTTGSRVFVTHDFLLRIIELYFRNGKTPSREYSVDMLTATHRNTYLRGFVIDEGGKIVYLD